MKRRRIHFAAHGQWTRSWTFLMGINERGINETINETIDEAKCGACVSVWESVSVSITRLSFFYFAMMCKPYKQSETYSPP